MSQQRMRNSNFRWVQMVSVGFFLFQIASLEISNDIRPPQNSSGITRRYNIF
jgi:hypothetical protein